MRNYYVAQFINRVSVVSDNGLPPNRCQGIIWTSAGLPSVGPLGANFSEISIKIQDSSFTKMDPKVSSAKWRPFCPGEMGIIPGYCIPNRIPQGCIRRSDSTYIYKQTVYQGLALLTLSYDEFVVSQPWFCNVASDLAANQKLHLKIVVSYPCFLV